MIKEFEKFEFFKKKTNDIYKRVTSNFNMLNHFSRFKKEIENDYHQIVKKYNISHVGVILDMTIDMVEKLDSELKKALNNHKLEISESFENIEDPKVGKELWFEYHCDESPSSADYQMYLHSHQKCKVIEIVELGGGDTSLERGDNGEPRVYKVKFEDGYEWVAFEDEIMDSPDEFERPDPPKIK